MRSVSPLTRSSIASTSHGGVNTSPWSATRFLDLIRFMDFYSLRGLSNSRLNQEQPTPATHLVQSALFGYIIYLLDQRPHRRQALDKSESANEPPQRPGLNAAVMQG